MRRLLLVASIGALAIPGLTSAQPTCVGPQRLAGPSLGEQIGSPAADRPVATCAGLTRVGYYDSYGNWQEGTRPAPAPSADSYSADVAYVGGPGDLFGREDQLQRRIEAGEDGGSISRFDADGDRGRLSAIRDLQVRLRDDHDGLTGDDRADLNARLDDLNASLNAQWRQ